MSRLPSDYTELEYIESSGTQYILVDYEINNNIKLECDFQFTELISGQNNIIGLGNGNYNRFTFGFSQTPRFLVGLGENFYLEATDYYTRKLYTLDAKNKIAKCNDEEFTFTGTFNFGALTKKDLILFARYSTAGVLDAFCKGKLYSAKYYDNDVLVRDLVPCKNSSNVVGMYDLVSESFFGNDGTGEFIGGRPVEKIVYNKVASVVGQGRLPIAYQEVEYLESSGEQYINTGIKATTSTGMDIDFAYTEISSDASAGVSGIYQGTAPRTDTFFISSISGKTNSYIELFHRGISFNTQITPQALTEYNVKINWLNDGKANFNDSKITNVGSNQVIAKDIVIFGRLNNANNTYSFAKARCYGVRFSEGSVVTMNLVPCYRKADNVAGMYDLVGNEFYTNSGSGTFEVGNDIDSSAIKHYRIASINNDTIKYYKVAVLKG